MKPHRWLYLFAGLYLLGLAYPAGAQTLPLQLDQLGYLFDTNYSRGVNWQSQSGVPLSSTEGNPPGSDGRAETQAQEITGVTALPPTAGQFQGSIGQSAVASAGNASGLNSAQSFAANASTLNWPRGTSDNTPNGNVLVILRSAQIGAPFFAQQISYFFGSVIPTPATDENGVQLPNGSNATYWLPQPYTTNNYANAPYYWSPNAQAVFATQAGAVDITWEKATPVQSIAEGDTNPYATNGGQYYRLYTPHYVISGAAVKAPQKMYWTEGTFQHSGQPVAVPQNSVSVVNVIYNNTFPQYVLPGDLSTLPPTTNTLWLDIELNQIKADNVEGRIFVELLGETNPDGVTRRFLGFEIVDVFREPAPTDVTVELGKRLGAFPDGSDDSQYFPTPGPSQDTSFFYNQPAANNSSPNTYYATRETVNLNDFLMYWLDTGVAGLKWPFVFDRYHEVWPTDSSEYVNYLRPLVPTNEAVLTGIQLPVAEAPSIAWQDEMPYPVGATLSNGVFYTYLDLAYPAHRTLLQFNSGSQVSFERVFSWLDLGVKSNALFADSVVTNLDTWDGGNLTLDGPDVASVPYDITTTVNVGDRITAPSGELGDVATETNYWAGYIMQTNGNSFDPYTYIDPFAFGFAAANQGAIIPVNAIPGSNSLEVWWFRSDNANTSLGFQPAYWPSVIGHYNIQWPESAPEIIMANNAGTGPLGSLQANGAIYRQPDPTLPGYNPNEEHAVMIGGQAYALRDDLNVTNTSGTNEYTSAPYVLIQYEDSDGRPSMSVYHVRREAPEEGSLFDYVVNAGTTVQSPMPLPLLNLPIEGAGASATNYNTAPPATSGDLPAFPTNSLADVALTNYPSFTFEDRKHSFWVYRGLNSGLPALTAGAFDTNTGGFDPLPAGTAVVGQPFGYYIHVSRIATSMTIGSTPALPSGLIASQTTNGLAITGTPLETAFGTYNLTITDLADNSTVTIPLSLGVLTSGAVVAQGPLTITSTNQYSQQTTTYINRPPFLAAPPTPTNSFTMRFYYVTQPTFDWPNVANPPTNGSIVPYLRPLDANGNYIGDPTQKTTVSQDIVYRPVWPSLVNGQPLPTLFSGQTLTDPVKGLPQVRGQSSVQVLYQQSIATNTIPSSYANQSVVLYDPTVQKTSSLLVAGLTTLPNSVLATLNVNNYYFQNLPPNLVNRVWYDPSTTNLVLQGQYINPGTGLSYLLLNVLSGADLAAVQGLCQTTDPNYSRWINLVNGLSVPVYTFHEQPGIPGSYVNDPVQTTNYSATNLVAISKSDQQVDSYAMCATGPGLGYVSFIVGNSINPNQASQPVGVYIIQVVPPLFAGQVEVIEDPNPLSESISFQHSSDLAGRSPDYLYDWRIAPPVNGVAPATDPSTWTSLASGNDITHYTLGGATGLQSLSDNYVVVRYRDTNSLANPANTNWSPFTAPQLAPGWIDRVVSGINPFDQLTTNLFDTPVDTTASIISEAGHRWEGDVALNANSLGGEGLIEIYETVLHTGENISINAGYNYGPANQALLLVTGYLNDLYNDVANEAWANSQNPTISIGTDNATYGDLATSMFSFMGEEPSLLEQDLALIRGRDDSIAPGVTLPPVYNRLYWNYTLGINAGEVIYALNYNIQDENGDGVINAADAEILYPMGHGDAYGHYLTALGYYYSLLMNPNFDWVPQVEAVSILGATVAVNYEDERKFAATAASVARTGEQVFALTWREGYTPGTSAGWSAFGATNENTSRPYTKTDGSTGYVTKFWGLDHWATRTDMGAYLNWVAGNAILPPVDPNPNDQGIQKVDRTTVPELTEIPQTAIQLQTDMDNAEAGFTPLNLSQNAIPFDINPQQVTGSNPMTHFEQIYSRALVALNNAVTAFNDAQDVTEEMRQAQNSLTDYQNSVTSQELAFNNQLIELYGTPYPNDIGPGQTYAQGYNGPDLIHYMYVDNPDTNTFGGILPDPTQSTNFYLDIQNLPSDWSTNMYSDFNFIEESTAPGYTNSTNVVSFNIGPDGFFDKPASWTSERGTVGSIQQAISTYIAAQNSLRDEAAKAVGDKRALDKAMNAFVAQSNYLATITALENDNLNLNQEINILNAGLNTATGLLNIIESVQTTQLNGLEGQIPVETIVGTADGGDYGKLALGSVYQILANTLYATESAGLVSQTAVNAAITYDQQQSTQNSKTIANDQLASSLQNQILALANLETTIQGDLQTINGQLRTVNDAQAAYQALIAQGNRVQAQRLTFRQAAAAVIQGYRTSDAAFILFQNEKLQRYLSLFNLAAQYAFLAAQAYDYETGLLNTPQGQAFVNQIVSSQALGVVDNGIPQITGTDTGDPGLANALAEMDADWQVLKGRLGFNNPDGYGTTVSLRSENYRILTTSDGNNAWQQVLQNGRMANILDDPDVEQYCLQIDDGSGLPVPGIVLTFSTTIADGLNLFGNPLSSGDHTFSPTSFATKIFSAGVCFDGYAGMDNPSANGGVTPPDPALETNALSATPYIYFIPVGVDSMRSPPLGDTSAIRTWNVNDVAIPLPFNIGGSDYSSNPFYTSADSLTEPLFAIRKFEAFRPVSTTSVFNTSIYGANGSLQPSQYSNSRLIGRSIWNSRWKLIIPGRTLLSDPNQGLDRFIQSVNDIHLYFITYSYAGN